LHVRLPVYNDYFLLSQQQIAVFITKNIEVTLAVLELAGMVAEIKALQHQVLFPDGGFIFRVQAFEDAAFFAQDG